MSVRDAMQALLKDLDLSPRETAEREAVAKRYPRNPFVYQSRMAPVDFTVGFATASRKDTEPLWWTGSGFKNLAMVRGDPESFGTRADAEAKVRLELIDFIRKYRADQAHLIVGW